ncbi:MAG: S-layer homology domain-containing protein [Clostridia bacterium]|nr:S-layer homology domain-containing protein [Clostridia bacterium]
MKKLLSLLMVTCLALAMFAGISVFAADDEYKVVPTPAGAKNLVQNSNMDDGLTGYSPAIKDHTSIVTDDEEHGNVIRVERSAEWDADKSLGVNSSVSTKITGLIEGAEYQLSVDLKIASLGENARTVRRGPMFMITYDDKTTVNYEDITDTKRKWKKVGGSFVVPAGVTGATVTLRFFGYGEIFWDNLEVVNLYAPPLASISAPAISYTEWEQGTAKLDFTGDDPTGYTYYITIKDGAKKVFNDSVAAADYIDYKYDLSALKEIGKEYTLTIELKDAEGAVGATFTRDICRYDRPSHISENGFVLDGNGEEFYPVVGYTTWYEDFAEAARLGVNVVPTGSGANGIRARFGRIDDLKQWIDEAWNKHGIMSLITCYGQNYSKSKDVGGAASCPENIELLKETVTTFKDHPGVLGYLVLDEPYNYEPKVGAEEVTRQLKEAYKIIREIDKDNLIMHTANKPEHWANSIDYSDIIISDRYPQSGLFHSVQFNYISKAKTLSDGKKPVWNLLQAGKMATDYDPNGNDLRNMIYQTMFAKGEGIGYIATSPRTSQNDGLMNHPDMVKLAEGLTAGELDDAVKAFVTGEYPTFCELTEAPFADSVGKMFNTEVEEDYWFKAYKKDGQLYMLVLNHENRETPVEIKLTSTDGSEAVGEFTATVADTFNEAHTVTGNNVFKTTLAPRAAVLYKIDGDVASAPNPELEGFEWAADAIGTVTSQGIANKFGNEFKPGEAITRADFAGWLIRTLGLSAEATDNFADVAADEYYAKEIAIGKAIGVLNGVGNNNYDPKAPISRQDLMVICTRGMKLVKELKLDTSALDVFSDNALIADYAKEGITGMVTEGIIKGNADGTINPLGNTTRAEAAVIMARILGWK